jgi:GntR family transcriptional regulator
MGDFQRAPALRRRRVRVAAQTSRRRAHDLLRSGIRDGVLQTSLAEEALTASLWATRNAVRDALHMLVDEGLISRQPRHGTNVVRRVVAVPLEELAPPPTGQPGEAPVTVEQLETRTVPINAVVSAKLDTGYETVVLSEQLISIDGEAVCLRTAYLVTDLSPEEVGDRLVAIDGTHMRSASAFEQFFGVPNGEVESTIEAVPGERDTCALLGVPEGAPVLFRESVHRDVFGKSRMLVYSHYRSDRIAFSSVAKVEAQTGRNTA